MVLQLIFWVLIFVPVFAYVGYPLTLMVLRKLLHRGIRKAEILPTVTLLIPAYNERENIGNKLRNTFALDYPAERLQILIACDGSQDGTPELARNAALDAPAHENVQVLDYSVNRGKMTTLNEAVRVAHHQIIVFSDASAILNPDAIRKLVRSFADSTVGAVSGKYTVIKPGEVNIGASEDFYWNYETYLKTQEGELSSTLGGHGHLHAIRRELYPFPPPRTINDDYVIHASVIAKGWRAVYEPEAVIREEAREMTGFARRVRIMAGNVQQLREIRPLLRPVRPLPLFFFVCHKGLRLIVPFALLLAFLINLLLLDRSIYRLLFLGQLIFYLLALLGTFLPLRPKLLRLPYYFSMINAAAFLGFYYAFTGLHRMRWK